MSNTNHHVVNKSFGPSASTANPIRVAGSVEKAVNGQRVYRYGKTTGWTYGITHRTNISINASGTTLLGMSESSFNTLPQSGDSGGPVYIYAGGYKICGILSGSNSSYGYYTPFGLITDKGYSAKSS
ncbi:hypothetical protein HCH52_00610 [Oscillospiraceae bacterium HV4-5-C5C]|nr:hypothetical protein [Oscillospiraceae bacterium HV4-5-C5C]